MEDERTSYDVIVVGGGPAGAASGIRLARYGRRVLILERQRFPRFHIGESLLPASNAIFHSLGIEPLLRAESFVVKRGASFTTEDGEQTGYIDFSTSPEVTAPVTYQVLRSRFDEILLLSADQAGAEVRQACSARHVVLQPDRVTVTASGAGRSENLTAQVLVDASGQAGFLAKRLDLRRFDNELRNVAVYAHFEGIPRPSGDRSGDIRIVSRRDLSWIWLIPVSSTVTSVGVVIPRRVHARPSHGADQVLLQYLAATPFVAAQMGEARRVSDVRYEADFCYAPRAYAGRRWLVAGDAGSFIDPVFSSGVQLALSSGVEAADAIHRALGAGDLSPRAFAAYQRVQRRRYKFLCRLVRGFYRRGFRDLFVSPANHMGILDAMVAVLAGNWSVPIRRRWKIEMFFALTVAQRFIPLAPRSHRS